MALLTPEQQERFGNMDWPGRRFRGARSRVPGP
jgi:hypothetical protein